MLYDNRVKNDEDIAVCGRTKPAELPEFVKKSKFEIDVMMKPPLDHLYLLASLPPYVAMAFQLTYLPLSEGLTSPYKTPDYFLLSFSLSPSCLFLISGHYHLQ
jgi:hypothetical protein